MRAFLHRWERGSCPGERERERESWILRAAQSLSVFLQEMIIFKVKFHILVKQLLLCLQIVDFIS